MKVEIKKEFYALVAGGLVLVLSVLGVLTKSPAEPFLTFGLRLLLAVGVGVVGFIFVLLSAIGSVGGAARLHHAPRWFGWLLMGHFIGLPLINGVIWGYVFLTKAPDVFIPWKPMLISLVTTVALPYIVMFVMLGLIPLLSRGRRKT